MSIGSIAASGSTTAFKSIPAGIKTVHVADLPGSAERASRLIDTTVQMDAGNNNSVRFYTTKLQHDQASQNRISAILENLPDGTTPGEVTSWKKELAAYKSDIDEDHKQLERYRSLVENDPTLERTLKFASGHLRLSSEEVHKLFNERKQGATSTNSTTPATSAHAGSHASQKPVDLTV